MGLGGPGNGGKPRENMCFLNVEVLAPLHSHYISLYIHQFVGKHSKNQETFNKHALLDGAWWPWKWWKTLRKCVFFECWGLGPPYIPITFPCIFTSLWENTAKNKEHSINMHFWMGLGGPGNGGKPWENACFLNVEAWAPLRSHYISLYIHQFVGKHYKKTRNIQKTCTFGWGLVALEMVENLENMCVFWMLRLGPPYVPITFHQFVGKHSKNQETFNKHALLDGAWWPWKWWKTLRKCVFFECWGLGPLTFPLHFPVYSPVCGKTPQKSRNIQ